MQPPRSHISGAARAAWPWPRGSSGSGREAAPHCAGMYGQQLQVDTGGKDDAAAGAAASAAAQLPRGTSSSSTAAAATTGPEPEPETQQQQQQQQETGDGFEALGLGPDLHDYREPYRQYLPRPIGTQPPCRAAADSECCCCVFCSLSHPPTRGESPCSDDADRVMAACLCCMLQCCSGSMQLPPAQFAVRTSCSSGPALAWVWMQGWLPTRMWRQYRHGPAGGTITPHFATQLCLRRILRCSMAFGGTVTIVTWTQSRMLAMVRSRINLSCTLLASPKCPTVSQSLSFVIGRYFKTVVYPGAPSPSGYM